MKVLVVYESKFGNTERVAQAIASGLKGNGLAEVVLKRAKEASQNDFKDSEAWVIGSPTHITGASPQARKAMRIAVRSGAEGKVATGFDTRFPKIDMGAIEELRRMLRTGGVNVILEPKAFIVQGYKGPLAQGEEEKARRFGEQIASVLR